MPVLKAEVREALKASIREHGVVCRVVKDQTGYILDGYNRDEIATELGIKYKVDVQRCTPDQREMLRYELNTNRRQLTASEWKPMVDHLRSLTTSDGSRFSDASIAQAVGVSEDKVQRYKTLGPAVAGPSVKKVGKDGVAQNSNPKWTATDRVLYLIRESTSGLTAEELRADSVLHDFGSSTVGKIPTELRDQGLVEAVGTRVGARGRPSQVWKAVVNPPPPPPKTTTKTAARKAEQIVEGLKDERVRDAVKETVASDKGVREARAALRAAERELDAARLDDEKRAAEQERDRLKLIEVARSQADKSIKTWDKLAAEVRAAWTIIAAYSANLDDLPAINAAFERILDRELDELRQQMDWLDKKLHPGGGRNPVKAGTIIDVD